MKILEQISLDDVLDYIGINYEGVKEAIIECAATSKTIREFFYRFQEYYSEHGCGGDDCWMDVRTYLPLVIKL